MPPENSHNASSASSASVFPPRTEPASFLIDRADVSGLRAVLSKLSHAASTENSVTKRLGLDDLADLQWRQVPIHRSERLADRDLLAIAIDLFLLQGELGADELDRLFVVPERDLLVRAGLLALDETGVARARASLFP